MIEIINYKKKNYALILRSNFKKKGINFFTSNQSSFQLGYINYKSKHQIKPHYHPRQKKIIYDTNEVLFIKKGKIKVNFFETKKPKKYFQSKILKKGDTILILNGGHGFEVINNVEMIEVKQGPYLIKNNKVRFDK